MEQLNVDEIMALQALGMKDAEIRKLHLDDFDRMLEQNPDLEDMLDKANKLLDRQEEQNVVSIPWHAVAFLDRLRDIGRDCPAVIHCKGNIGLLSRPNAVAVIGARAADKEGNDVAYRIGRKYASEGNVIVSGLALGCDTAAHRGCLDAGGDTIAIVGNGLDICHPKENVRLVEQILASFIDDLDEIFTYYVSTASATGDDRVKSAMNEAVKSLPVSLDNILEMLFCICGCGLTAYDISSVMDCLRELPDDISIDWGTVFDEDIPENEVKVILLAMV